MGLSGARRAENAATSTERGSLVLAGPNRTPRARKGGLWGSPGRKPTPRARNGALWCSPGRKTTPRARKGGLWCSRGIIKEKDPSRGAQGDRWSGTVRVLLYDGLGSGALGEDEGGDDICQDASSKAEDRDNPGKPYEGGINVEVVGNAYAYAQKLAAFFLAVKFLLHFSIRYWLFKYTRFFLYLCIKTKHMKRITLTLLGLALCLGAVAQPPRPGAAPGDNPSQSDTTLTLDVKEGLFGVANKDNDWYFEIPDDLLGRRILAVTRFVTNTVGSGEYGGEEVNEAMVYWEKAPNGNLLLRADVLGIQAKDSDIISRAVQVSSENPIVASFKPEKGGEKATRIKVNSLFETDVQVFSLNAMSKRQYNLGALNRDATYLSSIRTYPINTEVTVTKTYAYNAQTGAPGAPGGGPQGARLPAGVATGAVTLQMNTSFLLLPEEPMQPRMFDPRVGYFADGYNVFSDDQQSVENLRFICRWRLEAKPEDVERQKRGELVEPIKPIVYYIDPATPKQWRKYLIAGVNDWQVAFEQAGWKNAIHAEEWPEDNPDMSLEDARFAVIRYLASDVQNAYGPNVHDPRSGEILESHIGWYHNVMSLVHDWYQIQAGAVDPRARSMKFSEELMGDLIRFVSSHEVGHTLGLRHNMGSSSQTPVEKLRDKEWLKENGHTVSIMDYARFN